MEKQFLQDIIQSCVKVLQSVQVEEPDLFHSNSHKFILKNAVCILHELRNELPDAGYIGEKVTKILGELDATWLWKKDQ